MVRPGIYRKITRGLSVLFVLLILSGCAFNGKAERTASTLSSAYCKDPVVIYKINGDYDEVWEDLKMALNDRGLVISSVSHVGEMLERTGKALGRTRKIYERAKVMEFCSAVVSRDMLEVNPHYISFCPYQIMVYSLPGKPDEIYISYRHLIWKDNDRNKVLDEVEELLKDIINDVRELHKEYE